MKHPRQRTYPTWITLLGPEGTIVGKRAIVCGVRCRYVQSDLGPTVEHLACLEQDWSSGYEIKKDA